MDFFISDLSYKFEHILIKPISDVHIGSPFLDEKLIRRDIDWAIKKPNRFLLLNGDIMNTATTKSVSNTYENTMSPHEELKFARRLFLPARHKVLAMTGGNHERRIYKDDGFDVVEELAESLDCKNYCNSGVLLKVRFGRRPNFKKQVYTIYLNHGFTSSRTVGGKANNLLGLRNIIVSDVYILSHSHEVITFSKNVIIPDLRNNKLSARKQTFINTGAYLNYGGYSEEKAYQPARKGTVILKLYAREKRVEVIS